jgi:hypothetical protein
VQTVLSKESTAVVSTTVVSTEVVSALSVLASLLVQDIKDKPNITINIKINFFIVKNKLKLKIYKSNKIPNHKHRASDEWLG